GWQVAATVGPALGGVVIAQAGQAAGAYLLAALGSVACAGLVASIHPQAAPRHRETVSFHSLLAGIRFIGSSPLILATLTLDLFAVLLGGATALLPIFAKDILDVGASGLAWLRAAPSLGALLLALLLASRPTL